MEQIEKKARTIWVDEVHGFKAETISRTMAWMLIRNKCHELNLPIPTMDKIKELKPPQP